MNNIGASEIHDIMYMVHELLHTIHDTLYTKHEIMYGVQDIMYPHLSNLIQEVSQNAGMSTVLCSKNSN